MEETNAIIKDQKSKATTSLVLWIIWIIAWLLPIIWLPIQIIGLVFGIKAWNSSNHTKAVVWVTLSIIGLVLTIINASIGAYMAINWQHAIVNELMK
jgi:hypothetical protein